MSYKPLFYRVVANDQHDGQADLTVNGKGVTGRLSGELI